jgi:hypothetical protein
LFREALGVGGHGEEGIHGGFVLNAVAPVDLFLAICSGGVAVVEGERSCVGVERPIVDLFAEEEEV